MQFFSIIFLCVFAAICYGIVHDQITARICVEYFTIGHAPIFGTDDPTLLGLAWGVWATWWVGVMLGVPLALAARVGSWPKRTATSLVRPLMSLILVSAVCAIASGIAGCVLAQTGNLSLTEPLASRVPTSKHVAFIADLWAHNASYVAGFIGGGVLMLTVWLSRCKAAKCAVVNR